MFAHLIISSLLLPSLVVVFVKFHNKSNRRPLEGGVARKLLPFETDKMSKLYNIKIFLNINLVQILNNVIFLNDCEYTLL